MYMSNGETLHGCSQNWAVNTIYYLLFTKYCLNKRLNIHSQWSLVSEDIIKNIARGTTDPEIDSVTWTKFSDHMATLVPNLATHALIANLATRRRHLHQLQIGPQNGKT